MYNAVFMPSRDLGEEKKPIIQPWDPAKQEVKAKAAF